MGANRREEITIVEGPSDIQANDVESIKEVKMSYWRCVDNKLWDKISECFAEDAVIDYPNGVFRGRQAITDSLKQMLSHGPVHHEGRCLIIEMTGDTSARGSWEADVSMTDPRTNAPLRIRTSYDDEYVKQANGWLMRTSRMRMMPTP
jgi:ketosteroid isomerase-like protein